jgi:integrase
MLMLTCARRDEIGLLKWDEVDLERGVICLPPPRTKTRTTHIIPLTPGMRRILEARPQRDGREYVFGRGRGFSGWSACKVALDKAAKLATRFTLHDLRRSSATKMADIGIAPHIIELALGHHSRGKGGPVAATYNRSSYQHEVAQALQRLDEHLTALVAGRAAKISSLRG